MQSFALVRWKTSGFTLVETFLALTIGGLILGSLFHLCITQPQLSEAQDTVRDMVQNAKVALEVMTRELRMAGYNPTGVNFDGITYAPTQLRLRADLNGDGDTDDPDEDIRYIYDAETQQIIRADCTGQEPLAEHIQAFTLTGLDAQGKPTTVSVHIRQLRITLTARAAAVGAPAIRSHGHHAYTLTTSVNLRNVSSIKEPERG
jgi:type IV pilus assembly protein PilW